MFEGLLLKTGICPRPWPRLGVPLMVPPEAIVEDAMAEATSIEECYGP